VNKKAINKTKEKTVAIDGFILREIDNQTLITTVFLLNRRKFTLTVKIFVDKIEVA
jgi:hypothetical protein